MRTIRASELGGFLYCRRAWWYQRKGLPSRNQREMAAGTLSHQAHSRGIKAVVMLRLLGVAMLMLAGLLIILEVAR